MTSIELLKQDLDAELKLGTKMVVNWDMYIEIHKQEIIDAVGVGSQFDRDYLYGYHDKAEQYYQETFISKGSDDHISDISKMIVYTHDDVIKMMDTFHTSILNRDLCMAKLTPIELPQHPPVFSENGNELLFDEEGNLIKENQQKISDEEIEKEAIQIYSALEEEEFVAWKNGAKWYREQLRLKVDQNQKK